MRDVCVKAKAKLGRLPKDDIYQDLLATSDLEKKYNILQRLYPSLDYRQDKKSIEAMNFRLMYEELKSISYFLSGLEDDFFKLYFSKYEILYLQEIIESLVFGNLSSNYLYFSSAPMADDFNIQPEMDLESFINANKMSPYYRILLPFFNKNMQKDAVIFLSSNALVKFYYRNLLKLAKKFGRKERKLIEDFLGEEINLLNLEMLYRLKSFYELDDNEIFNYLIEGGNNFNGQKLKEISLLPRREFLDRMATTKYKKVFLDTTNIHMEIKKRELRLYRSEITKGDSDILYVISAMNIMFLSGEDVQALLELDDSFTMAERMDYIIMR